jgi:hypothetical protein
MRTRYRSALLAILACGVLLPAGCARFDDTAAGQTFSPAPVASPESPPEVQGPGADSGGDGKQARPGQSATPVPPPQGCKDFDPAVISTCLDTVAAVAGLPGDGSTPSALAGERKSGRVLLATAGKDATDFAKLDVQAAGDGGLTGLALSPSYVEDQLVFAYVTTATDNRVVRFAKGQAAKPVLTGIPKGATGNRGTISADNRGALLVATGDAGNPNAAADPNSLAGKVLRIDTSGKAAAGNPSGSLAVAAGLHAPGGLCASADGARVWVTDRLADKDALYRGPGRAAADDAGVDVAGQARRRGLRRLRRRERLGLGRHVAGREPAEPAGDGRGRGQRQADGEPRRQDRQAAGDLRAARRDEHDQPAARRGRHGQQGRRQPGLERRPGGADHPGDVRRRQQQGLTRPGHARGRPSTTEPRTGSSKHPGSPGPAYASGFSSTRRPSADEASPASASCSPRAAEKKS